LSKKSYRWVIVLLSVCMLSILLVQFYGLKQMYQQRKDLFDLKVYEALESISTKINELSLVELFKSNYGLGKKSDTTRKSVNTIKIFRSKISSNKHKTEHIETKVFVNDTQVQNDKDSTERLKRLVSEHFIESNSQDDSLSNILKLKIQRDLRTVLDSTEENQLLERIITEVQLLDVNNDAPEKISAILKQELELKGLVLPFEYKIEFDSLGIRTSKLSSKNFEKHQPFYEYNLSAKKIIKRNRFLLLQFPDINAHILRGMQAGILVTGIFILIISLCYYYIIKLILNQKKLSEMKNDFVNNITHELKTPIATASLAIDTIKNQTAKHSEEQISAYLYIVKEEMGKLNLHVERVMQIALMDQNKSAFNFEHLMLEELIEESIHHHQLQFKEQSATLHFEKPTQKLKMCGDRGHLVNAFNNILDNALKYSNSICRIKISIQCEKQVAKIIFQDNGIGIADKDLSRVFEKFYRAPTGNLHNAKGFGVGLSYVKMVVEAHGGSINVESHLGKGSKFIIILQIDEE